MDLLYTTIGLIIYIFDFNRMVDSLHIDKKKEVHGLIVIMLTYMLLWPLVLIWILTKFILKKKNTTVS